MPNSVEEKDLDLAAQLQNIPRHCAMLSFQHGCTHQYELKRSVKSSGLISWQICFYHLGLCHYKIHACTLLLNEWYAFEPWKWNCYKHLKRNMGKGYPKESNISNVKTSLQNKHQPLCLSILKFRVFFLLSFLNAGHLFI